MQVIKTARCGDRFNIKIICNELINSQNKNLHFTSSKLEWLLQKAMLVKYRITGGTIFFNAI